MTWPGGPTACPSLAPTNPNARNFGYLIKPLVADTIPADAKIADIGTGTGVWARAAAKERPSNNFTGFDISDAQFPPADSLPSNLTLTTHDLRLPFPEHLQGTFDVVHLRLLTLALPVQDAWNFCAKNVTTLLKPGGWVQWEETDFVAVLRNKPQSKVQALRKGFADTLKLAGDSLTHSPQKLQTAIEEAGLMDLDMDVVSADRLPEMRPLTVSVAIQAVQGIYRQYRNNPELKLKLQGSKEDDEMMLERMREEAAEGAYCVTLVHCITGRKTV